MVIRRAIGKYDFELQFSPTRERSLFSCFARKGEVGRYFGWWKFFLSVEDGTLPHIPACAQCDSHEIREVRSGDESLTYCDDCCTTEGGYVYLSNREVDQ